MMLFDKLNRLCRPAKLTRGRMAVALVTALVADALQIPGQAIPLVPELIDVVAMIITTLAIGFHVLLLPTFAIEFIPLVDMIPTWTGCVVAVLALRKREGQSHPPPPPIVSVPPAPGPPQLPPPN